MPCGQGAIDWADFIAHARGDRLRRLPHGRVRGPGRPQPRLARDRDRRRLRGGRQRGARAVPPRPRHRRRARTRSTTASSRSRSTSCGSTSAHARRRRPRAMELRSYNLADLGAAGHPGVPRGEGHRDGADREHGAARPAPAARDRHDPGRRDHAARGRAGAGALHALRLDGLLAAAHVRAGRGHGHDHRPLAGPARALVRRRPVADPPRLQPDRVRQQPRLEHEDLSTRSCAGSATTRARSSCSRSSTPSATWG